jgi:hypothetical protein
LLVAVAMVVVATACSSHPAQGTIRGRLLVDGGFTDAERTVSGTVSLTAAHGTKTSVHVGSDGRYRVRLPVGSYRVMGSAPFFDSGREECFGEQALMLRSNGDATVDVRCHMR